MTYSPDGKVLVTTSLGSVYVWSARTHRLVGEFGIPSGVTSLGLAFGRDANLLATADRDGKIRFWDVRTSKQTRQPLTGDSGAAVSLA